MKTYITYHPTSGKKKGSLLLIHGAGEHIGRYSWAIEQWNLPAMMYWEEIFRGTVGLVAKRVISIASNNTSRLWMNGAVSLGIEVTQLRLIFSPHSLGGLVAARFLQTRQSAVKGVILSSPCFGLKVAVPAWKASIAKALNVLYPSLTLKSEIDSDYVTRNREIIMQDQVDPLLTKVASVRWFRELVLHMQLNWNEIHQFPDVPLLIHEGGGDLITDKEEAKKWFDTVTIKNKVYQEWPGLYHEVLNEPERDQVIREMITWMNNRIG